MDRRDFLKKSAIAGAALAVPACTGDEWIPTPYVPGRHRRGDDDDSDGEARPSTSLFTASDRHEMGSGNNLKELIAVVAEKAAVKPSVVLLGGDYVGGTGDMTPVFSINSLYEEVYTKMEFPSCEALFTYGSHDNCCSEGYSAFFSGPHRCDGYYIYGITYVQMACATDSEADAAVALHQSLLQSGENFSDFVDDDIILSESGYSGIDIADRYGKSAQSASANFLKWAESLNDNLPIIVMSHMPLHYNRGDNYGGLIWYDALSKIAEDHDILFLWGHNHTCEEKAKDITDREDTKLMDRFSYLLTPGDVLTPGDTIDVQGAVKGEVVKEDLNFSYANAGYIKLGYGTVLIFSDSTASGCFDSLTLHRYGIASVPEETEIGFTDKPNPYTIPLRKTGAAE